MSREYTKAEAEALDPRLKEISVIKGPVMKGCWVEVEAENASQAAIFVRKALVPQATTASKFITVKAAGFEETSAQ